MLTTCVIPLSLPAPSSIHVPALFGNGVWFPPRPSRVLPCLWSTIHPVELVICLSVEAKPHTVGCDCLLLLHQVEDELIFIGRFDDGKVSSQILACSSRVTPLWDSYVDHKVTWLSARSPAFWTRCNGHFASGRERIYFVFDVHEQLSFNLPDSPVVDVKSLVHWLWWLVRFAAEILVFDTCRSGERTLLSSTR